MNFDRYQHEQIDKPLTCLEEEFVQLERGFYKGYLDDEQVRRWLQLSKSNDIRISILDQVHPAVRRSPWQKSHVTK